MSKMSELDIERQNSVPEISFGPDTGQWNYYSWYPSIDGSGNPITQWADNAQHLTTYQVKYPTIFVPGFYSWNMNFMPVALGSHSGYDYSVTDQEFRFELLNEDEEVIRAAKLTFDLIENSFPDEGPITVHVKQHGNNSFLTATQTWEYDSDAQLTNPPVSQEPITEFNGVRVYWTPYIPVTNWSPSYNLKLYFAPNVAWYH